jgi:hypothetical protein
MIGRTGRLFGRNGEKRGVEASRVIVNEMSTVAIELL